MSRQWMSVMLTGAWLAVCTSAWAQAQPMPEPAAGPMVPPAPGCSPEAGCWPGYSEPQPTSICITKPEQPCCTTPILHVGFEYLLWYTRKQTFPTLATLGPSTDPVPAALGQTNTTVVFGGRQGEANEHSGGRLTLGLGIERDTVWSADGNFFALAQRQGTRSTFSEGAPGALILARPFTNAVSGLADALPISLPGLNSGNFEVTTPRLLYGGDLNLRYNYYQSLNSRIVALVGGRVLFLEEGARFRESTQDRPGGAGNRFFLAEDYTTYNNFYGGQVGGEYEFRLGPVFFNATGKVAFGSVHQTLKTSAFSQVIGGNGNVISAANTGLYIGPSNSGSFTQDHFAVVPEANVKVGVDFSENVRLTIGYTFIYLNMAARPADQINTVVNPLAVGPAVPPIIQSSGFWAQGLDVGLRFGF